MIKGSRRGRDPCPSSKPHPPRQMYAYKIAGRPNLELRIKGFRAGRGFDERQPYRPRSGPLAGLRALWVTKGGAGRLSRNRTGGALTSGNLETTCEPKLYLNLSPDNPSSICFNYDFPSYFLICNQGVGGSSPSRGTMISNTYGSHGSVSLAHFSCQGNVWGNREGR